MVKVCSYNYPKENEDKYKHFYDKFKYDLHHFQKWTIEGIVEGHHVLVTAPTGSGKSFGAEFAIEYFCSIGKKVIYTSPIKSLSNQKFITREYSAKITQNLHRLFEQHQSTPEISFSINSTEAIKEAVIENLGIALVPYLSVARELKSKKIIRVDFDT